MEDLNFHLIRYQSFYTQEILIRKLDMDNKNKSPIFSLISSVSSRIVLLITTTKQPRLSKTNTLTLFLKQKLAHLMLLNKYF
jgi:hypothetical protein